MRSIPFASTRNSAGPSCSIWGRATETFEAAREIINCYHITFVKGPFARRGRSTPIDGLR
jgi:hypothetical protein